jgi:hypothetical protein
MIRQLVTQPIPDSIEDHVGLCKLVRSTGLLDIEFFLKSVKALESQCKNNTHSWQLFASAVKVVATYERSGIHMAD